MNDELNKLYTALIGKGYTTDDLGDESTFRSMMSDKDNRKDLYDYVSERGDFRIGDYDAYEQRLTSQPLDKSQYTFTASELESGRNETALIATTISEGIILLLLLFICIKRMDKEKLKYIFFAFIFGFVSYAVIGGVGLVERYVEAKENESRYYVPQDNGWYILIDKKEKAIYVWDREKGRYNLYKE